MIGHWNLIERGENFARSCFIKPFNFQAKLDRCQMAVWLCSDRDYCDDCSYPASCQTCQWPFILEVVLAETGLPSFVPCNASIGGPFWSGSTPFSALEANNNPVGRFLNDGHLVSSIGCQRPATNPLQFRTSLENRRTPLGNKLLYRCSWIPKPSKSFS